MSKSRDTLARVSKNIWQQRILPLLDVNALVAFSRANKTAYRLALLTLQATRLVHAITRRKPIVAAEISKKKERKQESCVYRTLAELMQILRCMPVRYRPFIPYLLMLEISQNKAEVILKDLLESRNAMPACYESMKTSCINTTLLSLLVMTGYANMKQINFALSPRLLAQAEFTLPLPSGASHQIIIDNVFSDNVVRNEVTSSHYNLFAARITAKNAELNKSYDDDNKVIAAMHEYIHAMEFMNICVSNLREHINDNAPYTTTNNSYLYTLKASIDITMCHHNFLIEQFYCDETQSVRYRLYQSWIGLASLADYLGHEYSGRISHSWDDTELDWFLTRIEVFYSNLNSGKISEKDCFGMGTLNTTPRFKLHQQGNLFRSASLTYYCKRINPALCMNHLTDYVSQRPALSISVLGK